MKLAYVPHSHTLDFCVWNKPLVPESSCFHPCFICSRPLATVKSKTWTLSVLFKGFSTVFLRPDREGLLWEETSMCCYGDVIFLFTRHFLYFEGDNISSAQGYLPSSERAINLLNCGKAFLGMEHPISLFVITPNAPRASHCSFPGVFPWEMPQAVAASGCLSLVFIPSRELHFSKGQLTFLSGCLFDSFPSST